MTLATISAATTDNHLALSGDTTQYLTVYIGKQLFGLPITDIQDVIETMPLTHVPLSPKHIAGIMNLRGRIVTALHLDRLLGLPAPDEGARTQSVVFEHDGELYSLIIHQVGDVMTLQNDAMRDPPPTLDDEWLQLTSGIFRLDSNLLMILDINRIIHKLRPAHNAADET